VDSEPLSSSSIQAAIIESIVSVHAAYLALMQNAANSIDANLGGALLYIGELDEAARTCATAANIAGAATLAASSNSAMLRQSQREGVIDFLVNSLDEALRILKNEIRKRQPVSVAVSMPSADIAEEMLERGVLPDMVPPHSAFEPVTAKFLAQGTRLIVTSPRDTVTRLHIWVAPPEYAQNLAAFEALLAGEVSDSDHLNRRWLRLSPRYLAPAARRLRSIACDESQAEKLSAKIGKPPLSPAI